MTYFTSQYLNIYPSHRDSMILFHGVTGAIDEVTSDLGKELKRYQRTQEPLPSGMGGEILEFLLRRGHVTRENAETEHRSFVTHVEKMHKAFMAPRLKSGSLMLVPSYYCNLSCPYCYQNPMRANDKAAAQNVMTRETVDTIFEKVLPQLYPGVDRFGRISINLYGGEPFLERNRAALERIIHYTRRHQMPVSAISNAAALGTFLPLFGIQKGLVSSLQISFDGDKMHHDRSRITHYGGGTFDAIVENVHRLIDQGCRISLRINASKDNVDTVKMLRDRLDEERITTHPNVVIYAAAIHNHFNQTCSEPLLTRARLSQYLEKNAIDVKTPLEKTMSRLSHVMDTESRVPLNRTQFCMQNMPQSFLIDFRRDIYGCYEEAGNRSLAVGSFDESGAVVLGERYDVYQSRHVAAYEPCSKCAVALTCGGGCPVAARGTSTGLRDIFQSHCDSHRELVAKSIQRLFKNHVEGGVSSLNLKPESELFADQPHA